MVRRMHRARARWQFAAMCLRYATPARHALRRLPGHARSPRRYRATRRLRARCCPPDLCSERRSVLDETQELVARLGIIAKRSEDCRRDSRRVLLLDAAHHHAQMCRLDHNPHTTRLEYVRDRLRDLYRETFLHLQASRKDIHHARELGQTDDPSVRYVRDMRLAEEREHVMLAHRVQLDVAYEDHVRVFFLEHGVADDRPRILTVSMREKCHRARNTTRRLYKPLARRVFAEQCQLFAHHVFIC